MIIIFSSQNEISTSAVINWLNYFGKKVIRINCDDDTYKFLKIDNQGIYFGNTIDNNVYNLLDATACWWRRTGIGLRNFTQSKHRNELKIGGMDITKFVQGSNNILLNESTSLRDYIFSKIYEKCQINIGSPYTFSLNKLLVLDIAKKNGLMTPQYVIVSNTNQIFESCSNKYFITKAISEGIYESMNNYRFYTYTELYDKEEFINGCDTNLFQSLIMDCIEKKIEIRSFYLSGSFYSMAIFSQGSSQTSVDFRKYDGEKPNKCEPYALPKVIEQKLEAVFNELNLNCGSVDIILDRSGEYYFLEINPVGQYGMTSQPCNYNLDKIIAKNLIYGKN